MPKQKRFAFHWGEAVVEEEVQIETAHHRPTVQLLRYEGGELDGERALRFCYYDLRGRFQRSPLVIGEDELRELARALAEAPELRRCLDTLTAAEG